MVVEAARGYRAQGAKAEREEIIQNIIVMRDAQEILAKTECESNEFNFIQGKIMAYTAVLGLLNKRA
jgi:hypothetical protein